MIKSKLKISVILIIIYVLAAATIYLTSFSCDWEHSVCNQGLETASFPGSLIVNVFVYPVLRHSGGLETALKNHSIQYDIFYPSFFLNLLIFYGIGNMINEFLTEPAPSRLDKERSRFLSAKPSAKNQVKATLLVVLAMVAIGAVWQFVKFLIHH